MIKLLSKVLFVSILLISITTTADYYIEKSVENFGKSEIVKIWSKDTMLKIEFKQNSKIYNRQNDSIRYESHILKTYWEGSIKEFSDALKSIRKTQIRSKKNKKIATDEKMKIKIISTTDSTLIADYNCLKYIVLQNDQLMETFYYTNKINIFTGLDKNTINLLINEPITPATIYKTSDTYLKFIANGLIMKRETAHDSVTKKEYEEVISLFNEKVEPNAFNIPDGYQLMPLKEILKAESEEFDKMKIR